MKKVELKSLCKTYYPHLSRNSVSPVCGIFLWMIMRVLRCARALALMLAIRPEMASLCLIPAKC